jgi:hypothetical protein
VSSAAFDVRAGQAVCFAAGPAVLAVALYKLARLPVSQAEALIGTLAALAVALQFVVAGLLLPLTNRKDA